MANHNPVDGLALTDKAVCAFGRKYHVSSYRVRADSTELREFNTCRDHIGDAVTTLLSEAWLADFGVSVTVTALRLEKARARLAKEAT